MRSSIASLRCSCSESSGRPMRAICRAFARVSSAGKRSPSSRPKSTSAIISDWARASSSPADFDVSRFSRTPSKPCSAQFTGVIERLFVPRLDRLPSAAELKDPKTRLQETLQARGLPLPSYVVDSVSGEAHSQMFQVSCSVDALGLKTHATGASRRRAEQAAAQLMLEQLQSPTDPVTP
jgi:hypothetical protein